jgi:hypothetical protein
LDSEDSCSIPNKKGGPVVYWTLRIVVVFRIRKEAPLVYWTLRIVVVFRIRKDGAYFLILNTTTILRVQ